MASSSNRRAPPQLEDPAPPTSASAEPNFKVEDFKPPANKLVLRGNKRYHVFLSFRGDDVRDTLVDHLFQDLSAAGLNVFLDSEKLEKGNKLNFLFQEIKSSAIHIPIFSEFYADSTWCLREAAAILNNSDLIIPLFYRVVPAHVRYPESEKSIYKGLFDKHYGNPDRFPRREVKRWKNALEKISSRSGWTMGVTEGFEVQLVLVKKVVKDLIQTLDRRPFQVAKHPVGTESVKSDLIEKLDLKSVNKLVKVGIWGIGGIGKTTVAKAVYNRVYDSFDAASFVFNVRTIAADPTGLIKLQKQILRDLIKYDGKVHSIEHGISLFIDRLGGKRVLLILDDVDAVEQLNALVGNWLFSGSRIIVTSRDKHILNVAQVSSECIHEMSTLEITEALQLFSQHAFGRASPSRGYENLSEGIVQACKGHPLSLELFGSILHDKQTDVGCWTETLRNICVNPDLLKRLYISYSALSDEEKEIFLDIACFFIGEHTRFPILFWKSLYEMVDTAVCNLSNKLLIKIDDEGVFQMHDHLRDLGLTIATKEREGTRLWEADHLSIISNGKEFSRLQVDGVSPQKLEMLYRPGLRYLHLHNLFIEGITEATLASLPPSLIWLRLENCPFGINRATRRPRRSRFMGNIWQLKTMQLKFCSNVDGPSLACLFSLPNIGLQHLDLRGCINLNSLPDSLGNLSQLHNLSLEGCVGLNNLPNIFSRLSQLQLLDLQGCVNLNNLPDTLCELLQLKYLDLKGCVSLNRLPDSIGNLSKLQHLDLKGCVSLNRLPDSFRNLLQLQHLDLEMCENLDNNNIPMDALRDLPLLKSFRWIDGRNVQFITPVPQQQL